MTYEQLTALIGFVTFTEAKRRQIARLRKDPKAVKPKLPLETVADLHEWKVQMRAYDAAQIELGIATPKEVQRRNESLRVNPGRTRVLNFV